MADSAIASRGLLGMEAPAVTVETHLPGGLPGFTLVGLPETSVREARDRVKSALQNCGFNFPSGRVVVNLAPADLVKEGARYDLAIAVSILCATKQVPYAAASLYEYIGELSLYGDIRGVRGVLGALQGLQQAQSKRRLVAPSDNAAEASLQNSQALLTINHLAKLQDLYREPEPFVVNSTTAPDLVQPKQAAQNKPQINLDQVVGQEAAKRALLVAAAGGHHLLMVGPPGSGKTMLARCLQSLLPPLSDNRALEVGAIYSAAGLTANHACAPFREPHHSASAVAMAGGGSKGHAQPGEISLAHNGVLFLDEMPHFKPSVLDLLREPMSNGYISIARARNQTQFPARFQLLAAMNPCPAGLTCDQQSCRCTLTKVRHYQNRISGPLLDRIDLQVNVPAVPAAALLEALANPSGLSRLDSDPNVLTAAAARLLVQEAQQRQLQRQGCLNAELGPTLGPTLSPSAVKAGPATETTQAAGLPLATNAMPLMQQAIERLQLSARGYQRMLRVAQTIADLDRAETISEAALGEALAYRGLDWGNQLGMLGA